MLEIRFSANGLRSPALRGALRESVRRLTRLDVVKLAERNFRLQTLNDQPTARQCRRDSRREHRRRTPRSHRQ